MNMPAENILVDSHCHLDFDDFADDLDEVVVRAAEAGVGTMVTICTRLTALDRVLSIAERRSEEHTSELQSLMRISYAVFCLKKKKKTHDVPIRTKCQQEKQRNDRVNEPIPSDYQSRRTQRWT